MKIYLIDDDKNIVNILKIIIKERNLGKICGISTNAEDALDDIAIIKPDIIIVDLLMPVIDGISFVKKAKVLLPNAAFIMLSQVSSKDMVASAYNSGIEFYIQKPINSIEIEKVITKISKNVSMERAFKKMQNLFLDELSVDDKTNSTQNSKPKKYITKLENIMQRLGIIGELGSKDIVDVITYLIDNNETIHDTPLINIFSNLSSNPKTVEQRIRRAANTGLINIANLGIEDYSNDTFVEFSSSLYNFEQVKKEMDCIRGKSKKHGKISMKNFLNSLVHYSTKNY
ncbi:response regulator [Sedimentibacter sp. zth1]|uniref:response regulator n=1 Tax=Sedimentibacter sp. zth1 TaxID=2816908 RepID=UPI001A92DD45|nr:response regulator [Sedimentibacter sp. zth1]QSX06362.1 response regulator [Sedimentibacter sp. zth1]